MKKMRIATMITGHFTCPPPKGVIYAPMLIMEAVAEGLTKKGHKVFFFGPEGSKLKVAKMISGGLKPLYGKKKNLPIFNDPNIDIAKVATLWDQYLISLIYRMAIEKKVDLIHIHPVDRALPFGLAIKEIPIVYTLHDPIYLWRAEIFKMFQTKNQYYVSISNAQRKPAPNLNWVGTVYNGLDLKKFPFSKKHQGHLLFLGRLLPQKGPDIAIQAAIKTKEKLIIAGSPNKGKYWEEKIKPYLSKNIKYIGNIPYEKTNEHYKKARALLCPIQWEEPFGLTFIEAMACGTPVIAFDRGSVKEVIKNGKTGFIVKNLAEMNAAIKKIGSINRSECRKWVEQNFTIEKMASDYEKIFLKILTGN